ncbi:hypothetical protein GGS21DRAFT_524834 [Xylaria nigripes]|nr:hypothetical protein GGS21DRAFT_524834 [Xylaria nigripes]
MKRKGMMILGITRAQLLKRPMVHMTYGEQPNLTYLPTYTTSDKTWQFLSGKIYVKGGFMATRGWGTVNGQILLYFLRNITERKALISLQLSSKENCYLANFRLSYLPTYVLVEGRPCSCWDWKDLGFVNGIMYKLFIVPLLFTTYSSPKPASSHRL